MAGVGSGNSGGSSCASGAEASAILYSLIETAKANRREPYWYLRELFGELPHARTPADYVSLLPTAPSPPPASQRLVSPDAYRKPADTATSL